MNGIGRFALALALLGVALLVFWKDWLTGDELYFAGLAALSAIAFYAALDLGSKQFAAEGREELIKARDEVNALKTKVQELQAKLEAAQAEFDQLRASSGLQPQMFEKNQPGSKALDALREAGGDARALGANLDTVLEAVSKPLEQVPERHRLLGLWITVGLSLAVLAFFIAKDVSIGTSSPDQDDTTPVTTETETTTP